jgi:hypothetical protein
MLRSQIFRCVAAGLLVLGLAGLAAAQAASAQPSSEHRLNKKELKTLLGSASTPADHEKLARMSVSDGCDDRIRGAGVIKNSAARRAKGVASADIATLEIAAVCVFRDHLLVTLLQRCVRFE